MDDIQMVRIADDYGAIAVVACVPHASRGLVCFGDPDQWAEADSQTSVIVDTSGIVQITDHSTLSAMAAWFTSAAVWLKTKQMEESLEHGEEFDGDDVEEEGE